MPLRVLIVEDNPDSAETLRVLVKLWGHEVRVARDGEEGLQEARGFHPQVILLDIGLPKLDGFEVAKRVRKTPGLERVLLIAITGYGTEEDHRKAAEAGLDFFLVKPCNPAFLRQLLSSIASLTEEAKRGDAPSQS